MLQSSLLHSTEWWQASSLKVSIDLVDMIHEVRSQVIPHLGFVFYVVHQLPSSTKHRGETYHV